MSVKDSYLTKEEIINSKFFRKNFKEVNNEIFKLLKPYMKRHSKQIYVDLIQIMYYIFFETLPDILMPIHYRNSIVTFYYRGIYTSGLNYNSNQHCQALIIYKILDIYKYFDIIMKYLLLKRNNRDGSSTIKNIINYQDHINQFLQNNHIDVFDFLTSLIIYVIYTAHIHTYVGYVLNIGLVTELEHCSNAFLDMQHEKIFFDKFNKKAKIISFKDIHEIIPDIEKQNVKDIFKPLIDKIEALIDSIKHHPNNFNLFRATINNTFNVHQDTYRPLSPMIESPVSPLEWSPSFKGGKPKKTKTAKTTKTVKTTKATKATKATKTTKTAKTTKTTKTAKTAKTLKQLRQIPKKELKNR
jgi:hypothetical protein